MDDGKRGSVHAWGTKGPIFPAFKFPNSGYLRTIPPAQFFSIFHHLKK
jgi:hypothetical protein